MKNDKRKNQPKDLMKKKAAHLEESLREKLSELVRGLGHDVVDVSEEIIKMSKRLTRKLSKKMKNVLTPGKETSKDFIKEVKIKSKSDGQKKMKKVNKPEAAHNEKHKKNKDVTATHPKTEKVANVESNTEQKQSPFKTKKPTGSSVKKSTNREFKNQTNPKLHGPKSIATQSVKVAEKAVKKTNSTLKKAANTVSKATEKTVTAPATAKKASLRNATIGAVLKKPSTAAKKTTTTQNDQPKRKPGRPVSAVKADDPTKTDKKPVANSTTAAGKLKATPTQKKSTS